MPFNLGFGEIFMLLVVAVLVFGGSLPDAARRIGQSISEIKRGWNTEVEKIKPDFSADIDNESEGEGEGEDEPPPDWTPPPDGEDCTGLS